MWLNEHAKFIIKMGHLPKPQQKYQAITLNVTETAISNSLFQKQSYSLFVNDPRIDNTSKFQFNSILVVLLLVYIFCSSQHLGTGSFKFISAACKSLPLKQV